MRQRQRVFVDTGAWIALALTRDPLHARAREAWDTLLDSGAQLYCSIPVVLETFTFLDRNASRDVALAWKDALGEPPGVEVLAGPTPTNDTPSTSRPSGWPQFLGPSRNAALKQSPGNSRHLVE